MKLSTHGGSLRIYVSHSESNRIIKQSVKISFKNRDKFKII